MLTTLAAITPFAAGGGGVVFDYGVPPASLDPPQRAAFEALAARVAAAGNRFADSLSRGRWSRLCRGLGFREVRACRLTN